MIDRNASRDEIQAYLRGRYAGDYTCCAECGNVATYRCLEGAPTCPLHRSSCCHLICEPTLALLHDTLRVVLGYGEVEPHRVTYSDTKKTYVADYRVLLVSRDQPLEREAFWEQVLLMAETELQAIRGEQP